MPFRPRAPKAFRRKGRLPPVGERLTNILRIRNKVLEARIVTPIDFSGHRPSLNLGSKALGRFCRILVNAENSLA